MIIMMITVIRVIRVIRDIPAMVTNTLKACGRVIYAHTFAIVIAVIDANGLQRLTHVPNVAKVAHTSHFFINQGTRAK